MQTSSRALVQSAAASPLLDRYRQVRRASLALAAPLSSEDQAVQSMPDASPTKWHLAHTSWFFETFLLIPRLAGYKPFDPVFGYLFNSYYEAVGERHPRPARGMITRPSAADVVAYRAHVDAGMERLLGDLPLDLVPLMELGLAHEEQHQELILMDILHLFSLSPLYPAYRPPEPEQPGEATPMGFIDFPGGEVEIGHAGEGFAFDNEGPRHTVMLRPYRLADRMVTNGEWRAFMDDGGYARPEFWHSDGWALVQAEGWRAPFYWRETADGWRGMSLCGLRPLDPAAPVSHVSFYEASAYAAWAGRRLPSEFEWEAAAAQLDPNTGRLNTRCMRPAPAGPEPGLRQIFGDLWEWTASPYTPYPGFETAPGAVGEYNGKFMINQMVLRGGACVTPAGHVRATYRNFFHPHQRWMFSGVRLAEDAPAAKTRAWTSEFAADVVAGLGARPKTLPAKYFYDDAGSLLFEAICELPEYYPTRTETALLRQIAPQIAALIPVGAALVELGSGASDKTRILLDAAPQIAVYAPIDISPDALDRAAESLRVDYPALTVVPVVGDFTRANPLPAAAQGRPLTGFFPGSTIGNFEPREATDLLAAVRRMLGAGARFLVGFDVAKAPAMLVAAYDDAAGVTAQFNKNLLVRINRELSGDFDLAAFDHRAVWNAEQSRMEMHLVSRKPQRVRAAGKVFAFEAGETIHTENSHKYSVDGFERLAAAAGWRLERHWVSDEPQFGVALLVAP